MGADRLSLLALTAPSRPAPHLARIADTPGEALPSPAAKGQSTRSKFTNRCCQPMSCVVISFQTSPAFVGRMKRQIKVLGKRTGELAASRSRNFSQLQKPGKADAPKAERKFWRASPPEESLATQWLSQTNPTLSGVLKITVSKDKAGFDYRYAPSLFEAFGDRKVRLNEAPCSQHRAVPPRA